MIRNITDIQERALLTIELMESKEELARSLSLYNVKDQALKTFRLYHAVARTENNSKGIRFMVFIDYISLKETDIYEIISLTIDKYEKDALIKSYDLNGLSSRGQGRSEAQIQSVIDIFNLQSMNEIAEFFTERG